MRGMKTWALILLAGFLTRCDLFTPRSADPPLFNNSPYQWIQPTNPDAVITDIELSFKALDKKYFLDLLADSAAGANAFQFIPDPGVASTSGLDFTDWGYAEEDQFLEALFSALNSDTTNDFSWSNQTKTLISGEQIEFQADYRLNLRFNTITRSAYPEHLSGQARLSLVRENGSYWQITRWTDLGSDSLYSWTYLKTLLP